MTVTARPGACHHRRRDSDLGGGEVQQFEAEPCSEEVAELGEGPVWDAARGELLWVDILAGRLHRARPRGGALEPIAVHQIGRPLGAAVPVASGDGWILAAGEGFARLSEDGSLRELGQ